jgi:hypothetical protein
MTEITMLDWFVRYYQMSEHHRMNFVGLSVVSILHLLPLTQSKFSPDEIILRNRSQIHPRKLLQRDERI